MTEQLATTNQVLPEEYKLIDRIRDMWSNNCTDVEIRNVLNLSKERWQDLLTVIKTQEITTSDNRIAYEKFVAKERKRARQLEELTNYSIATDQLSTAVKCMQLQTDMDRADIEMGQKLGILQGEVIRVKNETSVDVKFAALFTHLPVEMQAAAQDEMKELTQALLTEGLLIDADPGKGTGNTK